MFDQHDSLPARAGKVPALRRHARGTGTVRLSGQDHYLGPWPEGQPPPDDVQARYSELIARWLANGRKKLTPEPGGGPVLVKDLAERFLAACPADYPKDSAEPEQYRLALRPLLELHGLTAAAEFRPRHLEEVRAAMIRKGWARSHLNRSVNRVKRAFKWAVRADLIPVHVYDALRTVEAIRKGLAGVRESPRRKPATEEQVDAMCRHLSGPMAAMFRLLWLTGMRPGEVRRMRAEEVDRSRPDVWVYRPAEHKTASAGEVRAVALGPAAIEVLRPWLDLTPNGWGPVFNPRRLIDFHLHAERKAHGGDVLSDVEVWALNWWGRVPALRLTAKNTTYTATGFTASVRTARIKAKLPKGVSSYCLRHAVRMRIGKSHGDEAARAVLGQRHIETTAHYGRIDEARAVDVMKKAG